MLKDVIARRYAKALFESIPALEKRIQTQKDLESLSERMGSSHILHVFLLSPNFIPEEKITFLSQLAQREGWQNETVEFLKLLVKKNRFRFFKDVAQAFGNMMDEAQGRKRVHIVTAKPLSGEEKNRIRERLRSMTGQEVEVSEAVDPELLGGLFVKIGSKIFDGSLRGKLEALTDRLVKGV